MVTDKDQGAVTCPLFKQQNITRELKIKNLESLITSSLKCSTTADFSDLESAILAHSNIASASGQVNEIVVEHETESEGRAHDAMLR